LSPNATWRTAILFVLHSLSDFPFWQSPTPAEREEAKDQPFPQLVGALLYTATISWADVHLQHAPCADSCPAGILSCLKAAKHMLRYIKGTITLVLPFTS
jgi:hypothetical protein